MENRKIIGYMNCIRCGETGLTTRGTLYGDKRSRGWYRLECSLGHWADIAPYSSLVPPELRQEESSK